MSEKTTLPNLLSNIVDFLKKQNPQLSNQSRDGRINLAFNEDKILKLLELEFAIKHQKIRDWVDFSFYENNILSCMFFTPPHIVSDMLALIQSTKKLSS